MIHPAPPSDTATLIAVRQPRRLWPRRIEWQALLVTAVIAGAMWLLVSHIPATEAEAAPVVWTAGCSSVVKGER